MRQQFTSKERDFETGLDYFLARYHSATQGRFISTDPENYQARLTPTDPQAWNGYSYVGNNPLARTDPNGKGDRWEKFKNAVLHGCRCTDAEIEKKRQADEDRRRQELRDYSQTQGLNGYLIVSGPDGPQAVAVDSLNRSQVLQISQTIRYLYYGIQVEGVGTISHDEALSLISAVTTLPTTIGPTVADQISNGHAWSKHQGEFPGWSQQKFTQKIQETINNASGSNFRNLSNGRTAYWNAQEEWLSFATHDRRTAARPFVQQMGGLISTVCNRYSPMFPNYVVIKSSEKDLLRNVLNEVLNGFAIENFEETIGISRSELERLFEYFNDHSAIPEVQLTPAQALAVVNALRATLQELGSEEFHTRTGFDFAQGEIVLQRLTRL